MKKITRGIAVSLCAAMSLAMASCSDKKTEKTDGEAALTYWSVLPATAAGIISNLGETYFAEELQKATGVKIKYVHPAQGTQAEKFNIMMAAGDLPDIIEYTNWKNYPGGPGKAIEHKRIIDLKPYLAEKAPNINRIYEENPNYLKLMSTDDGEVYGFPFIRDDPRLCISTGIMIRGDYLDRLGLELPETIDEWETTLKALKGLPEVEYPMYFTPYMMSVNVISGAFDVGGGFYPKDGKIEYGPVQPGFKKYVETINRWYTEGLIYPDFASVDNATIDAAMINGTGAVSIGSLGSGMGRYSAAATTEGYKLRGAKYPVENKGDISRFGAFQLQCTGTAATISTSCSDLDAAFRLLDYGYSEEGRKLFQYGIKDRNYAVREDDLLEKIPFVDLPEKYKDFSESEKSALFTMGYTEAPFIQEYGEMITTDNEETKEARENWSLGDGFETIMPPLYFGDDEQDRASNIATEISTYCDEHLYKFFMGMEPISEWDNFIEGLKSRGCDELCEIYQKAYDKYLTR